MTKRQAIRDKVKALLTTPAIAQVGARVYTNRMRKVYPEELPCIVIYSKSESAEINVAGPREYKRTMKLAVEIIDKYGDPSDTTLEDSVDDRLDEIAAQVEQRLYRNETLDGEVSDLLFSDIETDFVVEGEQPVGAMRLTFDVEFIIEAPDTQPNLDAFEIAHVEILTQPDAGQEKTVDDIELPQV